MTQPWRLGPAPPNGAAGKVTQPPCPGAINQRQAGAKWEKGGDMTIHFVGCSSSIGLSLGLLKQKTNERID